MCSRMYNSLITSPTKLSIYLTSLLLLINPTPTFAQWPDPEPCTGACNVHDPSLVRRPDGKYFLFGSAPNVSMKTSDSISGPFTSISGGVVPRNTQLGAPDVRQVNGSSGKGLYWMYFQQTVLGTQKSNISVGWSETMEPGTWNFSAEIANFPLGNAAANYNRIDANLLALEDGKELYFSFGSYWDDIFQFKMEDPLTISPGSLTHLEKNVTNGLTNVGANPSEGSYQFAWLIGGVIQYYLFWSSGACCKNSSVVPLGDEYKVMVCRASAPTGPFVDREGRSCVSENGGTWILGSHDDVYAPGGQGVMYDEGLDSVIIYYHYLNSTNEGGLALFGWNYLDFDKAGWPYVTTGASRDGNSTVTSVAPSTATATGTVTSRVSGATGSTTTNSAASSAASQPLSSSGASSWGYRPGWGYGGGDWNLPGGWHPSHRLKYRKRRRPRGW